MKKNIIKVVALVLLAATLCTVFAACGKKLSGEYYMGDKTVTKSYTTYTFSGSKVTVNVYLLGQKVGDESFEAKYSIKDGEITMTWTDSEDKEQSSTQTFEELEDGSIKIGALTFKKSEN
ncbi:MAG: hypothetical protein IKB34_05360 [Clostridia bacterium]|nr:hypothetical protein [Clostridia bacterium]